MALSAGAISLQHSARSCLVLCWALFAAACQSPFSTPDTVLRIAIEAMPSQLDPRFATDAHSSRIGGLVFGSLLRVGPDGRFQPYLAESWECAGGMTWTFRIRSDFTFHDGTAVRAADVAATYEALMDPATASPKRAMLERLATIEIPSPTVIRFRLAQPDAAFLEAATLAVLPERLARAAPLPPEQLIGSGPYRLTFVEAGERVLLDRYPAFADGEPAIPSIEFKVVPDALMRAMQLYHGTVGFAQNAIDPDTTDWFSRRPKRASVYRGMSDSFQYLGINHRSSELADLRVRRALAHAIDRLAIVEHILKGQAVVATGLLPPQHWAYHDVGRSYRWNPRRAQRLLDAAGFTDPDGAGPEPRLRLSYKTTTEPLARRVGEVLAAQLADVGIQLDVRTYEWGTFYADVRRGNFQLYSLQWVGIVDPDIYRHVFHSRMTPPAGNNRGYYQDTRIDRLTERARDTLEPESRRRVYARLQRRTARLLPYIPLWWPQRVVVTTPRLREFVPHPSGDLFGLQRAQLH